LIVPLLFVTCQNKEKDKQVLLQTIEDYENAWAAGDFRTVESFFADSAKRLHTEPYVWNRTEIKRNFKERAELEKDNVKPFVKNAWKKERNYLEIRVEGNIAYDVFTTEKFKALHIWEKQNDGSWKILYDMGVLNYPCEDYTNNETND
jgi:ketosteroid isomerase-like protein